MNLPSILITLIIMGFITSQQLEVSDYYYDISKTHNEIKNIELIKSAIIEFYNRTGEIPSDINELNARLNGVTNNNWKDEFDNDIVLVNTDKRLETNGQVIDGNIIAIILTKGLNGTNDSRITNLKYEIFGDDKYHAIYDSMLIGSDRSITKKKLKKCQSALDDYKNTGQLSKITSIRQLYDNNLGLKFIDPIDTYDNWGNAFVLINNFTTCLSTGIDGIVGNQDDVT